MNNIKCCLCGNEKMEVAHADMLRCTECKLFIKKELPSKVELTETLKDFLLSACWNKTNRIARMEDAEWQLENLHNYTKSGKLFDVGAASGFFMAAARDKGWIVEGNDLSNAAIVWAKENFNLSIHHDFFEDLDLLSNEYDAVVLWNTLEHTHNPAETIRMAKRILKPKGLIYIKIPETPTVGTLQRYYEPWHFYEFRMNNVVRFLTTEGFVEKKINKYWYRDKLSETEYLFGLGEKF